MKERSGRMPTRRKRKLQKNERNKLNRATDKTNREYLEKVCDEIMEFKKQDVMI
jgi:hypothetical protein